MAADVVVAGGGVVGLALARRLAQAGASVTVLDAGSGGGQASIAAAGMLAPLAEAESAGPLASLGLDGLRGYPDFAAELREETGLPLDLSGPGMLRAALDDAEEESLAAAFAWQKTTGLLLEWLDAKAVRGLEPSLSDGVRAAVLSPQETNLEPRVLLAALTASCLRRGVRVETGRVMGFKTQGRNVVAVRTAAGPASCGKAVIAAGAWSAELAALLGADLPLFPVRGQMLSLRREPPLLRHVVYSRAGYLVPRTEGRLAVGATSEKAGFDAATTDAGQAALLAGARRMVPALEGLPVENRWAGLRPASADGLPVLGPLPLWENVSIAAGHYRNGILLAPITADLLAPFILGQGLDSRLKPFGAERRTAARSS